MGILLCIIYPHPQTLCPTVKQRKNSFFGSGSFLLSAIMVDENVDHTVAHHVLLSASSGNPSADPHALITAYASVASFCLGLDKNKLIIHTQAENAGGRSALHLIRPPAHPSYFHRTSHTLRHTHAHTLVHWNCQDDGVAHTAPSKQDTSGKKSIKLHFALLIAHLTSNVLVGGQA